MTNEELIAIMEERVFYVMFDGCVIDDHLGQKIDAGSWSVSLRADTLCRLIDMAKESKK
jgi:hypothetical protein